MAEAKVLAIPPGSLVVLLDVHVGDGAVEALTQMIVEIAGHTDFGVLLGSTSDGVAECWSLDDDIAAKLRALLHDAGARTAPVGG